MTVYRAFVGYPVPAGQATEIDGQAIVRWATTRHRVLAETSDGRVWEAMIWFDGFIDPWFRSNTHSFERLLRAWEAAESRP